MYGSCGVCGYWIPPNPDPHTPLPTMYNILLPDIVTALSRIPVMSKLMSILEWTEAPSTKYYYVCSRCFTLIDRVDMLEDELYNVKMTLRSLYKQTVAILRTIETIPTNNNNNPDGNEETEQADGNEEVILPKRSLHK